MTIGKTLLLVGGFLAAVALGIAIGPSLTHHDAATVPAAEIAPPPAASPASTPHATVTPRVRTTKSVARRAVIPASTEALQTRLKPVLNRGTNMTMAAEGFHDGEQFAMVAHASRNTQVPFVLLKHRVLDEHQTLANAIRASKPDADLESETNRARTEAKADLAAVS